MHISTRLFTFLAEIAPNAPEISTPSYEPTLFKMIMTLVGLIVLIVVTVWVLKRMVNSPFRLNQLQKTINIIDRKTLSPKSTLYIVEISGRKIAFVESQAEIRKLTEWSPVSPPENR